MIALKDADQTLLNDPFPSVLADNAAARMIARDMRSYCPDDILCRADKAATAVSLESRVPFLDRDVLAVSARLPSQTNIRGDKGKWAVRRILYQYVPRELIERPRSGFGTPMGTG